MGRRAGEPVGDMLRRMAANDERYGRDNPENPNNGGSAGDREPWENGADAASGGQ